MTALDEYERGEIISRYLTGWQRTIPDKGDVAAFQREDHTIHLHGTRTVRLTGQGVNEDLRFYDVAVKLAEADIADAEDLILEQQWVNQRSWDVDGYAGND